MIPRESSNLRTEDTGNDSPEEDTESRLRRHLLESFTPLQRLVVQLKKEHNKREEERHLKLESKLFGKLESELSANLEAGLAKLETERFTERKAELKAELRAELKAVMDAELKAEVDAKAEEVFKGLATGMVDWWEKEKEDIQAHIGTIRRYREQIRDVIRRIAESQE